MIEHRWYPVRCCCTPTKILGFLQLPTLGADRINVFDDRGKVHYLETRKFSGSMFAGTGVNFHSETAIYSDDRPLEFWRSIPGFVQASAEDSQFGQSKQRVYQDFSCGKYG